MKTHPLPIADKLPIKTLVARQLPTNNIMRERYMYTHTSYIHTSHALSPIWRSMWLDNRHWQFWRPSGEPLVKCYKDFKGPINTIATSDNRWQSPIARTWSGPRSMGPYTALPGRQRNRPFAITACLTWSAVPRHRSTLLGNLGHPRRVVMPVYCLYNIPCCRFKHCRYLHQCLGCGQGHPKSACTCGSNGDWPRVSITTKRAIKLYS